jgi:hypothetical protein
MEFLHGLGNTVYLFFFCFLLRISTVCCIVSTAGLHSTLHTYPRYGPSPPLGGEHSQSARPAAHVRSAVLLARIGRICRAGLAARSGGGPWGWAGLCCCCCRPLSLSLLSTLTLSCSLSILSAARPLRRRLLLPSLSGLACLVGFPFFFGFFVLETFDPIPQHGRSSSRVAVLAYSGSSSSSRR